MLLFSAQDLNLDKFGGQAEPLSLTIEFEAERLVTDASVPTRVFARAADHAGQIAGGIDSNKKGYDTNLVARLVMVQQEQITIFDGGCEKQSVYWDESTAAAAARGALQQGKAHADAPPQGGLAAQGF